MRAKKGLAVTLAALTAFCFTACGGGDGDDKGGDDTIPDGVHFVVDGNKATVSWDKKSGANGYTVEKSVSRYGTYEFVDYLSASETKYEADDASAYYKISADMGGGSSVEIGTYSYETELFGENTYVYAPTDDMQKIQDDFDEFYEMTYDESNGVARGEFRSDRFAALFKAGEYEINADVGYYTALYGLGNNPDDVVLDGMNVTSNVSLCNFWRTAENLAVDSDVIWAVSQATSLRRIHAKHNLSLSNGDSTSGGFVADIKVDGTVSSGSQQQFLSRNSQYGNWSGCVWNMAFVGVEGNIPQNSWTGAGANYTNIATSGALREKPFLTYDQTHGYRVFVPAATQGASGISWDVSGGTTGTYIPLGDFYVARSDRDTAATINAALEAGKHILFTAGIYEIDEPIEVNNADTVILGLGLATLRAASTNADTVMRVADVGGVCIGGILFDAGKDSETLLEVGSGAADVSANSPITLSDLFFRVGGWTYEKVSVDTCVTIDADNVIGDNLWVWRADHSATRTSQANAPFKGIGWTLNPSDTGIIINGDDATFYGLFVEHFLKYQTVWNGNGGNTYFYQSELPYDVPSFAAWTPDGETGGYASYYVSPQVETHRARSLGVYSYLRDAAVTLDSAIVCPEKSGVEFEHMITVWLSGASASAVNSVINGTGDAATNGHKVSVLETYPLSE